MRAALLSKRLLAIVSFISILTLSVPQGVYADPAPEVPVTPPVETVTPPVPEVTAPVDQDTPDTTVDEDASTTSDTTQSDDTPAARTSAVIQDDVRTPEVFEGDCVITSDTSTLVDGNPSVLVNPLHSAWTAIKGAASWIWGENPISDAVNEKSETFTKTFTLAGSPATVSFTIAADNSYVASINGTEFKTDSGEFNYTAGGQDTVTIPNNLLHSGVNTLTVTVKNFAMAGGTMETNPAGLLYTLNIHGTTCTVPTPPPAPVNVVASKVVCTDESLLPNWGTGGHSIGATTAADYVAAHPGCHLESGWQFEWGNGNAGDTGDSLIGPAGNGYTTFGPTLANGSVSVAIPSEGLSEIHLREVQKAGYIPFTHAAHSDNSDDKSAEFYCTGDALNYDNWDFIRNPEAGRTYYCVAFNAPVQQTSTVKMCKMDDQEQNLPGWTLMLKGAHVGSVTVNPDGADYSVPAVPAGNYILTASGAYIYRPGDVAASTSDAAYSLRAPSDGVYGGPYAPWVRENNFPAPNTGWLGIMLNHSLTDWGSVFHPDHEYALGTTLASTQDMKFTILDDNYSDNSGSMSVSVDHGYVGVTGEDGCTTFANVPYGTYTSAELNQAGWTNVSGTGSVTVDSPEETFTVVNHHVTNNEPTKYKVHIFKFLSNGETEAQIPNGSDAPDFPMIATYSIAGVGTNLNPGDGYVLGNGGGAGGSDGGLEFAANTIPLSAGDTYGTHEVTGGVVVENSEMCSAGKYYLKGYRVGTTLDAAKNAALSQTAPNFPSIAGDEYVIVVNAACPSDDDGGNQTTTTYATTTIQAADLATSPDASKWFFYNDTTDVINNALGSFVTGPTGQPAGTGSAQITLDATNNRVDLATYKFSGTKLADIKTLRFSAYSVGGVAGPTESPYLVFNVDFNGSDTWQKRMVFVPSDNGAVPQNAWNTYDAVNGGAAMWQYSGTVWPAAAAGSPDDGVSEFGTVPRSWHDILEDYPNIRVRVTDSLMGVRVGEPGPASYTGDIDAFVIGIKSGSNVAVTTYDFEPTAVTPTDIPTSRNSGSHSRRNGGSVLGVSTTTEPQGQVLGASCGLLLTDYLKFGWKNDAEQVKKLQGFLNTNLGLMLPLTGFFGMMTEKAVHTFQEKYSGDVLTPWVGLPDSGISNANDSTGFVYKTTQWKINMLNCPDLNLPKPELP